MDPFTIAFTLLGLVEKFIERGAQSGELSEAQHAVLMDKATAIFAKNANPAPPPPGYVAPK